MSYLPHFAHLRLKGSDTTPVIHIGSDDGVHCVVEALNSKELAIVGPGSGVSIGASSTTGLLISEDATHATIAPLGTKALQLSGVNKFQCGGATVSGNLLVGGVIQYNVNGGAVNIDTVYASVAAVGTLTTGLASAVTQTALVNSTLTTAIAALASQSAVDASVSTLTSALAAAVARIAVLESQFA